MPKTSTFEKLVNWDTEKDKPKTDQEFEQRLSDVAETFGTPHGRRTLLYIIQNTFQHDSPMTGNSQTYHNLGAMDYGRSIMDVVAIADYETFLWVHGQRANQLRERYVDKITKE
jgi:hypothetical protein